MKENDYILQVKGLKTYFKTPLGIARAVDGISFGLKKREVFALVGESGCGKSVTALSIMQILPKPAGFIEAGEIIFNGRDILKLPEPEKRKIRGNNISIIFQEPHLSLNPVLSIGNQVDEVFSLHQDIPKGQVREKTLQMLKLVGIPDPGQRVNEYPHQMSGGMKQRVMIAMALGCEPDILIADEPTTALDVTIQAQILTLIDDLRERFHTSVLLITHNLGIVRQSADRIGVMYAGKIVEQAEAEQLFKNPLHPYTRKLLESMPSRVRRGERLAVISGSVPQAINFPTRGCRFAKRCYLANDDCYNNTPILKEIEEDHSVACFYYEPRRREAEGRSQEAENRGLKVETRQPVDADTPRTDRKELYTKDLKIYYPVRKGLLKRTVGYVRAVDGVSLRVETGKTTALVGESGCGKSTLARAIVRLEDIHFGSIHYQGKDISLIKGKALKEVRRWIQIVFQDPYSSLNPRMMVGEIVGEGLKTHNLVKSKNEFKERIEQLLEMVGLTRDVVNRYPHEFSGGQRQRIAIARALAVNPKIIICDEATSALDVSVQAQILNLLRDLQANLGLSYLFITHDLSLVEYLADYIYIMYLGEIVEEGLVEEIFDRPSHPYTEALMKAIPKIDKRTGLAKIKLKGDVPSPINPPEGCRFHPRCPYVRERCQLEKPSLTEQNGRKYRCFFSLLEKSPHRPGRGED